MVKNFCQYIRDFAQQQPQETAFVHSVQKVTWKTLDLDIRRTAFLLQQEMASSPKNATVLLLISDTLKMIHAFFALIQHGSNPVLVNFRDTFHLQEVLAAQNYDWIIYDDKALENNHINMDTATYINDLPNNSHDEMAQDNSTMFSLYTSGTSGQPKYITKTYDNILSELQYLEELVGIRTNHAVVTVVPFIHIYGLLFGILLPCRVGATMVACSKILPSNILNTVEDHQANFLVASPVHYESLVKIDDCAPLNKLQYAISSGAPLRESVALQFFEKTNVAILEVYGSTETGGIAYKKWQSAGQQLHFFPYVVRDETLREGELRIQSPAISPHLHDGWYKTGDYITMNDDGSFSIKGRQQHLIKFAGKRIFATQLEEELKALPIVKDAAVVRIVDTSAKGERAVAFVCANDNVNEDDVKKTFAKTSSNASVIHKFFLQNPILLNHNNKVDYLTLSNMAQCKIRARSLKIGVIIPTYNHAHLLKKVIDECAYYINNILVVVDGSTDDTLNILQECAVEKLIFTKNRGKGLALKAGFKKAAELGWKNVITIDSDGQHFPSHIWDFVQKIEENPRAIIVGDRDMSAQHIPDSSKFGKKFTNFWLKVETGLDVSDGQSGFRAYPVAEINRVSTYFSRYEFEVEILARAAWHNIPITSIPVRVEYNPPGGRVSHFRPFVDNVRTSILNTILVTVRVLNLCYLVRFKKIVDKET